MGVDSPSILLKSSVLFFRQQIFRQQMLHKGNQQYEQLNNEQKKFVDTILEATTNTSANNNCFYIDGPGGSGKTFVYTTLYYLLKGKGYTVGTMAFTGIAATLLTQGKTVHKTFGLPVPLFGDSSSNIKAQSKEGQIFKNVDIFIWDEAPMAPRYAMEVINRTLPSIMENNLLFGGKFLIMGGDFRQLLPIKQGGTRSETINLSIKCSPLWKHFKQHALRKNMRAKREEQEFAKFVLDIGNGTLNEREDLVELPEYCIATDHEDIVKQTYGDLIQQKNFTKIAERAILSARNVDVTEINDRVVQLLDESSEKSFTSIDSVDIDDDNGDMGEALLPEYLNSLSPPSLPPHELRIRKNCLLMLIRNLNISEGLCNGTRLLVRDTSNHLLKCEILTGDKSGSIAFINRITLICDNIYPFSFKRRQFPVKVAFAMTINKSQGQTFEKIGLDLCKDVFNHGQLYVALSRVRCWEALKVYSSGRENKKFKNYVYKELFTNV